MISWSLAAMATTPGICLALAASRNTESISAAPDEPGSFAGSARTTRPPANAPAAAAAALRKTSRRLGLCRLIPFSGCAGLRRRLRCAHLGAQPARYTVRRCRLRYLRQDRPPIRDREPCLIKRQRECRERALF